MPRRTRGLLAVAAGAVTLFFAQGAQASTFCVNFDPGECDGVQKDRIQQGLKAAADHAGRDKVKIAGGHDYVAPGRQSFFYTGTGPVDVVGTDSPDGPPVLSGILNGSTLLSVYSQGSTVSNLDFALGADDVGLAFEGKTASDVTVLGDFDDDTNATGVFINGGVLRDSKVTLPYSSASDTWAVFAGGDVPSSVDPGIADGTDIAIVRSNLEAGTGVESRANCSCAFVLDRTRITAAVGLQLARAASAAVRDSLILAKGSTNSAASVGIDAAPELEDASETFPVSIEGSTIENLDDADYGINATTLVGTEPVSLRDSIVRDAHFVDLHADGPGVSISGDYNDVGTTSTIHGGTITPGPNDVNVDPGFAGASNFHLASSSPLIDIGDPNGIAAGESPSDVFGSPRVVSGLPGCPQRDIGAAEFKPSPLLPPTAAASGPASATVGEVVEFDGSGSCTSSSRETLDDYSWSFGGSGAQATHAFGSAGLHTVTLTVTDSAGGTDTDSVVIDVQPGPPPSHHFEFGKVKRDEKKGTAKLPVELPGPGKVKLEGKGLVKQSKAAPRSIHVDEAGTVKLLVKAKNNKKHKLKKHDKVTVKAEVTYTPTGGTAKEKTKTLTLKRKAHGH